MAEPLRPRGEPLICGNAVSFRVIRAIRGPNRRFRFSGKRAGPVWIAVRGDSPDGTGPAVRSETTFQNHSGLFVYTAREKLQRLTRQHKQKTCAGVRSLESTHEGVLK